MLQQLRLDQHRPLEPHHYRPAPRYIDARCQVPDCRRPLVLDDVLDELPVHLHAFDEWACPVHRVVLVDEPARPST